MNHVIALETLARLRQHKGPPASTIWVAGYHAPGDGGGGMFVLLPADRHSADNGGTLIVDAAGRRYGRAGAQAPYDIGWFGARADGTTDCTPALNSALAALPASGGEIVFPPGTYRFDSAIRFILPAGRFSLTLRGAGADVSILFWPQGDGLQITASSPWHSLHARDLSLTTENAAEHTAITLLNEAVMSANTLAMSDFTRLTFRAQDSSLSYGWGTALRVIGMSNVVYEQVQAYGVLRSSTAARGKGIDISGNPNQPPYYAIVHNLNNCAFFYMGTGLVYGSYLQGVTVSQCNFTQAMTGIHAPAQRSPSSDSLAQLAVLGGQFNCMQNQILIEAALATLLVNASLFYVPPGYAGIAVQGSQGWLVQTSIVNNSFNCPQPSITGSTGIAIEGTFAAAPSFAAVVTGNVFYRLDTGVTLGTNTYGWNVQANSYNQVTTNVLNQGTDNSIGMATA